VIKLKSAPLAVVNYQRQSFLTLQSAATVSSLMTQADPDRAIGFLLLETLVPASAGKITS
jgi:hypothetical protein